MEDVRRTEELKTVKKKPTLLRPLALHLTSAPIFQSASRTPRPSWACFACRRRSNLCSFCPRIKRNCCAFSGNNNNFECWHRRISGGNENSTLLVIMALRVFFCFDWRENSCRAELRGAPHSHPEHFSNAAAVCLFFFFSLLLLKADGNLPNNECAKTCWYFYCSCKFLLFIIYIMAVALSLIRNKNLSVSTLMQ